MTENKVLRTANTLRAKGVAKQYNYVLREVQKLAVYSRCDDDGICRCVTCGAEGFANSVTIEGGHFIPRTVRQTCCILENVWPQCSYCNHQGHGQLDKYAEFLGPERVARLEKIKTGPHPFQTNKKHDCHKLAWLLVMFIRPELKRAMDRWETIKERVGI